MISVSPALTDDGNLASRRAQKRYVFVGYLRTKLIHTPTAYRDDGLLGGAAGDHVVGDVDAVHNDAVLIAARAGDRAAIIPKTNLGAVIRSRAGLEGQQFAGIAAQGWQAHQHCAANHVSHDSVGGLEFGDGSCGDLDDLFT